LIEQKEKNPRRLTPRECARLMGFPDTFKIPVSDTQAYRQFGNSIVIPVVTDIAKRVISVLGKYYGQTDKRTKKLEHVSDQREEYETGITPEKSFIFPGITIQASGKTAG